MLLSICVLTYNRRGYLGKLIQPLKDSKVLEICQVQLVAINRQLEIEEEIIPTKREHWAFIEKLEP
jgi:hypothetical protein